MSLKCSCSKTSLMNVDSLTWAIWAHSSLSKNILGMVIQYGNAWIKLLQIMIGYLDMLVQMFTISSQVLGTEWDGTYPL